MNFLSTYTKTKIAVLIISIFAIVFFVTRDTTIDFDTQLVEVKDVKQIVSETGTVEPSQDATLSFARSGRIQNIFVNKGDQVSGGQVIATLETSALGAQLRQAEASLEKLLAQKTVEKSDASFENTKQEMVNILRDSYTIADDAILNKADQPFSDNGRRSPTLIALEGNDYYEKKEIEEQRIDIYYMLNSWEKSTNNISADSDFSTYVNEANANLLILRDYLTKLSSFVNKFQPATGVITATEIDAYQTAVSTARTSINTAISSLQTTYESYKTEKISFGQGGLGGETKDLRDIDIKDAQAKIDAIYSQINDAMIISPISGVVSDLFFENTESVSATSPVANIISDSDFEIKVYIPEDDIENISIGDSADVTFDAYSGVVFKAEVRSISLSATSVEGIPVFETTLYFLQEDPRIRPGLSADVDILSEEIKNVLTVSRRSVIEKNGKQFVRVLTGEKTYSEREITLGLRGEDGLVEVKGGLEEGEEIISFIEDDVLKEFTKE